MVSQWPRRLASTYPLKAKVGTEAEEEFDAFGDGLVRRLRFQTASACACTRMSPL